MRRNTCFCIVALMALFFVMSLPHMMATAADPCPNQTCNAGYTCGGQGGFFAPPGLASLCSQDQLNGACDWCDGATVIRVCTGSAQTRSCDTADPLTTCGMPKKGKCTESSFNGQTYYYCKDTAAGAGTSNCQMASECTGDTACPPNG